MHFCSLTSQQTLWKFDGFKVKEECVTLISLRVLTTGENIFSLIKTLIFSEKIPLRKLAVLRTDSAPNMIGENE